MMTRNWIKPIGVDQTLPEPRIIRPAAEPSPCGRDWLDLRTAGAKLGMSNVAVAKAARAGDLVWKIVHGTARFVCAHCVAAYEPARAVDRRAIAITRRMASGKQSRLERVAAMIAERALYERTLNRAEIARITDTPIRTVESDLAEIGSRAEVRVTVVMRGPLVRRGGYRFTETAVESVEATIR